MKTNISELLGVGADAMTNMYEVTFTLPASVSDADDNLATNLKVRTEGFNPPVDSQQTYEVHWKTISIPRPSSKITLDRTFAVTFRLDANYEVYKKLLEWKKVTSSGSLAYASQSLKDLGAVTVKALSAEITSASQVVGTSSVPTLSDLSSDEVVSWSYKDVWIESVSNPEYSTSNSGPAMITATFHFGNYTDTAAGV